MTEKRELDLILAKEGGKHVLYACRGAGKGCARNRYRSMRKPCDDCKGPLDESLTIEEVEEQLKRGDA